MTLFWHVVLTNGMVLIASMVVLALSPATVSQRVRVTELAVLALGLVVIVGVNGLLLRRLLGPLDRLAATMRAIDLRAPGLRLEESGSGPAMPLITGFNQMLDRLELERTARTARALTAQEAERRRIAQELHDEVGQSLTVVLLGLKQARDHALDAEATQLVDALQQTTREALTEVRRISQRLRPGLLEDLGLVNSLASVAAELTNTTGIRVIRGFTPGLPKVDAATELVLYRVAQEALTNVARHSHATTAELGLSRRGDQLVLRVADDGVGPPSGPGHREGAGIQGMRERALLVGGSLEIARHDSGGTEVVLSVPVAGDQVG
jgi:two-component system, NarL family, sensor histidine kinase UhpB